MSEIVFLRDQLLLLFFFFKKRREVNMVRALVRFGPWMVCSCLLFTLGWLGVILYWILFLSFTKPKSSVGNTTFIQSQNLQAMSDTATPAQFPGTEPPVPNQDDALRQNGSAIDPNTRTTAVETLTRPNNKGNQQPVTPVRAKRRSSETTIETSWLPPGWVVEDRIRTSGATAGTVDKVSCSSFSIN